jgi:anaerobic selenocysteine-containing dehydrogenase
VDAVQATDWDAIERESGLSRAQIEQAAQVYLHSRATILCWGMGLTQHRRSVATLQMLMNLLLMRGNIGKPGAGPCPVRGHSNVQGDRTMGIYEAPSSAFLDRLGAVSTPSARSKRCATVAPACSSRWAAISRQLRPIAMSFTPRCVAAR